MTLRFIHRIGVALVSHLALFCAMAVNCSAQLFPAPVTYDSGGGQARSLAMGDFNRDGIQDIAVINACVDFGCSDATGVIGILLGNSDGTFQAVQTYNSESGLASFALSIAVGDVNGDGKLDLAVANCSVLKCSSPGLGLVSILFGNGDGTFQPPTSYQTGGFTTFVTLTDLNGDGRADVVVSNTSAGTLQPQISVLLADATGALKLLDNYPLVTPSISQQPRGFISAADLNADGKTDLVVTTWCVFDCTPSNVAVLFGNGDGTFLPAVFLESGGYQPSSVAVGDLNRDGLKDLVVSNRCGSTCSVGSVAVFLANADGSFQTTPTYTIETGSPNYVAVADVNQDGIADLLLADGCPVDFRDSVTCQDADGNTVPGKVEVLFGNGDGTFQSSQSYQSGGDTVTFVGVGDFNGDGKADVVVANELGVPSPNLNGSVGVLLGIVANTVTALAVSSGNPLYGQTVTLTANVSSPGHPAPTGPVTFLDGATPLDTGTLVSGQALLNLVLPLGTHSLTVSYPGNVNFHASSSSPISLTVSKAGTQTTLTSSLNPSLVGQSVTFTATIAPASGTGPTGTVDFFDGTKLLGSVPVSGGAAVLNTSSLKQATHSITATYSGDGNFTGGTSDVLSQLVELATTTSLASSLNPSIFGQQVILTATVTAAGATPKGSVTFAANGKSLGNVKLAGGTATLGTTGLKVGSSEIIATYNGSSGFLVSSGALVQTVSGATTSTAITGSSLNPSTYGDVVTFTAVVSSNGGTPNGNVRFKAGSTLLGTATVSSGVATLTTSAGQLPGGADSITAIYNGTAQFTGSTSPAFVQTVNQAVSTTTLASSANPASLGQTITFTADVSGAFAIPAGKVRFRDGTTSLGVVSLTNGVAVYTTNSLSRKTHNVSATYEGSLNYLTSSANVQQVVR